jgi:hypothetical protein
MTLAETTRKLGVSFYAYLPDRITGVMDIPQFADLITQAAIVACLPRSDRMILIRLFFAIGFISMRIYSCIWMYQQ